MKRAIVILSVIALLFSQCLVVKATSGETPSGLLFDDLEDFVDDYMDQYMGETSPGAAVVVIKNGGIILSKGYGYADIDKEVPVDPALTVFEYGSISKLFVYTTIMQLWEQGQISLDTDIKDYLPDDFLKRLKYDDPINMYHIMSHTTGFEDYLFDLILTSPNKLKTLEQALIDFQPRQIYRPGIISAYSNYAVSLAAYIAQEKIGQDFYQFLLDDIFLPLGMEHTSAHPALSDKSELLDTKAEGYFPKKSGFKQGPWSYIPLYPAGSVNGTAEDLALFAAALMPADGKDTPLFEDRATLDEMLSQTYSFGPGLTGYAHGFMEWDGQHNTLGHGGNTAAFSGQMNIVPEERFGVIVLVNAANEMDLTIGLTEELIGERERAVQATATDLPDASALEGRYISARGMFNSFLELNSYLGLLNIKSTEPNKIELGLAGQSGIYLQTEPYRYDIIEANGSVFEHNLATVYFEVYDGKVMKMSGDYLPLQPGRTMPWLIASLIALILSCIYFFAAPLTMLIVSLIRKRKGSPPPVNKRPLLYNKSLLLTGFTLLANNLLMIVRMLANNFRPFTEMRIHIFLNFFLAGGAIALIVALIVVSLKDNESPMRQRILYILTAFFTVLLILLLIEWKFFNIII
ncbi:MAG TPA: serine hydrolase domain-containing protein [Bacillota bacterium]|nr:serine hydrolase domain-containing protein [Bacillota bacterium]